MHQLQGNWRFNEKASFTNSLSYTHYKRFTRTIRKDLQNKTEELTTDAGTQDTAQFSNFFWRSSLQYTISPKVSIQPGLELNHETSTGRRIAGEPKINDFSFFASTEYKPASWLNVRPGLRFVKNSIYNAPPIIPSLNTLFTINNEWALRAAYAFGFRAPALRELYFDFVDANHAIYGNPNLEAEKSRSFNASLVYSKLLHNNQRFTAEAGGFHNYFNNLISIGVDPNNSGKNIYINIAENKTAGFSAKARLQTQNWQAGIGGVMLGRYNRFKGEDYNGKEIPQFNWTPELNAEIMYTIEPTHTSLNFFYRFNGKRQIYQTVDGENITLGNRDAFHYGDFSAGQYINKFLTLTAGIRNVFNITDVASTQQSGGAHSTGGDYVYNYGRSYFLTLNFNYNHFKK
ncbi:TonB-dependent receptor [Niabella ginsengisoli]|uniref:TonB-dependent receptor n=2 Tax=Niabella ginsengisoli TaxID=522298 RepID=A0ABS9SQM8_9BACT|nr:TonB-dependent receptor [Niabella ginsengisoli]